MSYACRVAAMLRHGLVTEVGRLRTAGLEKNRSAARAIGYREVLAVLDGRGDEGGLAAEIAKASKDPAFVDKLTKLGADPSGITPAQFAELVAADLKQWAEAVAIAGVKLQ